MKLEKDNKDEKMTLGELNITRDDIVEIYDKGPERYQRYLYLKNLIDQGYSPWDIAKMPNDLNIGSRECIRSNARAIAKRGAKPKVLKGVEYLEKLDLLPMNIQNNRLLLLNLLISVNLWRGSRSKSFYKSKPVHNTINVQNQKQEKIVGDILDTLGCNWKKNPIKKKSSYKHNISYGMRVGHLVQAMGFEAGAKKQNNLIAPTYIKTAFSSLENISTPDKERILAENILRDFIFTLLFFRLSYYDDGTKSTSLLSFTSRKMADKHSDLIKQIANLRFNPILTFSSGSRKHNDGYSGILSLIKNKETSLEEIQHAFQKRVQEVIAQTPKNTQSI